ncbi:leucine-rich repeat domain-containing protein [Prevotella sp. E9-3]|uniref:leucine-rich repeat domain-containing protein n=1 Tax=Prevotella sp. E9-3 TaxID=2913621 RepID=UPI001EDC219A|nr:leucine-rich repeat domain-containing protein [Prevotella sp. E9-3]UKK48277.1 leucine-rich repeat domain-containing protein [Prevotella sp. E9-3]
MKQLYLKTMLLLMMCMVGTTAFAYDCEVDGIYYNLNNEKMTAEVTYKDYDYNSYSGNKTIPESITYSGQTYSVTSIGERAFSGCSGLTSITIPNSVTSIGERAFWYCSGLTSITIPNSVTSIGKSAFAGCSSLESMIVESGNTVYDSRDNCNAIIKTADNELLLGCKNSIIPNNVTSIGIGAFSYCEGLTSVTIPNSVTSIRDYAFTECSGLTSITIPNSVTSIGIGAFSYCDGLTSVTIPNSLTSIEPRVFKGCYRLTSITIPDSVTSIGMEAFFNCSGLTSITIGNSVTSIGDDAFLGCSSLTSVTIPNSVTIIGYQAFFNCRSLKSVTAHMENPCYISESVFLINKGDLPPYYIYTTTTLYVPEGSEELYRNTNGWKLFQKIEKTTSITTAKREAATPAVNYSFNGQQLPAARRGLNIIRMSDGTVRKVMVK